MTSFFNFREECEYKYDISVYNAFMESFDHLPLAATINGNSWGPGFVRWRGADLGVFGHYWVGPSRLRIGFGSMLA